jgi:hypothetical protein
MPDSHHSRRKSVQFRPVVAPTGEGGTVLDRRLLLSGDAAKVAHAALHEPHVAPLARHAARSEHARAASGRTTPAQEINKQYDLFLQNFRTVEASYVEAINQQSTGTVTASTLLTSFYQAGTASMVVQDAGVFSSASIPFRVDAQVGGVTVATYRIIAISGNDLVIDLSPLSGSTTDVSLNPTVTQIVAQVPNSAATSAASIFPSFITANSQALAVNLVSYFSSLPFKLPRKFAFPHQRQSGGAIQQYVDQLVVGTSPNSLEQTLLAIALPTTPGGDLDIYDQTIATAVDASRSRMLDGVEQIFANKLPVVPSNVTGSSSTSGTGSTSTTGTGTTGSSTTGAA